MPATLPALRIIAPASRPVAIGDGDGTASFLVGQDLQGRWVAVEIHGRAGGLFRSLKAACDYAAGETGRRPGAVRVSGGTVALAL